MIVALSIFLITIGSIAFHFWSPWWWTEVASNWGNMDDTILLTFWITLELCLWLFVFLLLIVFGNTVTKKREEQNINQKIKN